ncbi:ATP-dependent RNA helicase DbpA [Rubrivivax rivuli]|uniref:ATP-dependent RNA helicase DbpA n=1 Tax=Rubrivivax rivuli TaxID=1862385 RepID=A0A437RLH4_9BURK|nr:ATP-dependent RNA helicase DbpA [Rubrivivax rivuli]RVU47609.1 ATP-dependent RNA helicase DbpA [Rubrivivax rivuli]
MNPNVSAAAAGFDTLPLPPAALQNLARLGYTAMTPIQAAALPLALAGHDLLAQARTGSGKTAAFALALLARLGADPQKRSPMGALAVQALVLCPTRELADQVTQEIRRLAAAEDNIKVLTLCGGSPMRPQLASLEHGAHVVVGTPGRLMDHLERGSLDLAALNTLVLDEADRMLDMGFFDDIVTVVKQCPKQRQTLLFSATYPEGIGKLAAAFLREPKEVKIAAPAPSVAAAQIQQRFVQVSEEDRLHTVGLLLDHVRPARTLAFCNTKQQCRDLVAVLRAQGLVALELHGDLEQRERDQVLVQFSNGSASVLVATDIAARGLDIVGLEAVVNVDVSPDVATHTHRIGRTGRADAVGAAYTLASLDEMGRVGAIEQAGGFSSQWLAVDSLVPSSAGPLVPAMATLQILGGRKEKIRAGDVLGALTKDMGFAAAQVGKINVNEFSTYVAVARGVADAAVRKLNAGKVKGKSVKVRRL